MPTALLTRYRPPDDDTGVFQMMALSVVCLIFLLVGLVFVIRLLGRLAFGSAATAATATARTATASSSSSSSTASTATSSASLPFYGRQEL